MIEIKMHDLSGNEYLLHDDGMVVLALKEKPAVGPQARIIAWAKKGIYDLRKTRWSPQYSCWCPARFPIIKTVSFRIEMVHIKAGEVEGIQVEGFIHPRMLVHKDDRIHSTGYEEQLKLYPGDLFETRQEADSAWEKLRKKIGK